MFRELAYADDVNVVVLTTNDGNFCSTSSGRWWKWI